MKQKIISLLYEYKDYYAWNYYELPSLQRSLVEHKLPTMPNYMPHRQVPRRMSKEIILKVKEEIEKLLKVGFYQTN